MQTLQIKKTDALKAYRKADGKGREMLDNLFGEGTLSANIKDRIKTFQDVCDEVRENSYIYKIPENAPRRQKGNIAFSKMELINEVLNEGWEPDYNDTNQKKYYPIFKRAAGSGFAFVGYACADVFTSVGARLVYKSAELAAYAATQFITEYNDFLTI